MCDIRNYTSFFHDGSVLKIKHIDNKMIIFMESAEIDKDDLKDDIVLSVDHKIRGVLHIEGIKSIKENKKKHLNILKMKYPDAEISHFEMNQNIVELQIVWNSHPSSPLIKDFSVVEIQAEKIYWENIPDLSDNCCNEGY